METLSAVEPTSSAHVVNPPYVQSLCFSPSGNHLITGLGDGAVAAYDFESLAAVSRVSAHQRSVSAVRCGAHGKPHAYSGGADGLVMVWDVAQLPTVVDNDDDEDAADKSERDAALKDVTTGAADTDAGKADEHESERDAGEGDAAVAEGSAPSTGAGAGAGAGADASSSTGVDVGRVDGSNPETGKCQSAPGGLRLLRKIDHGSKINWLAVSRYGGESLVVADTSCDVTVYTGLVAATSADVAV